jgi:hypothetical protein
MHEHSLLERRSYWLLRDWLKHAPKKDSDYIKMRTDDAMKRLAEVIKKDWETSTELHQADGVAFKPTEPDDDNYTREEWLGAVDSAGFIDYDGFGYLATATETSNITIYPSDITCFKVKLPDWATHIIWYNR